MNKIDQEKREAVERQVLEDFLKINGQIILTRELTGYLGESDNQVDVSFDPPIAVRVVGPDKPEQGLYHWTTSDWCDPQLDVDIVDTKHSDLPPEGLRSCWIFGTSRNINGSEEISSWILKSQFEAIA